MIEFILNNRLIKTDKPSGYLLLDFIRYDKQLTGTKIGCREGDCGACNVLIGELRNGQLKYQNATSCLTPIGNVAGKHVVSIEGLNLEHLSPIQQAMVDEGGTQCGFCTVGFVVSLYGFCLSDKEKTYENGITAIDGNVCRCTGYKSIERAVKIIIQNLKDKNNNDSIDWLIENKYIPAYFQDIAGKLKSINKKLVNEPDHLFVGGGTDLYVQKHEKMVELEVQHVTQNDLYKGIHITDNTCTLGGATTVTEMMESKLITDVFPNFIKHMKLVSSSPIRNISTLGGNFVNASPIGDMTAFFIALNAKIKLESNGNAKIIFLKDLYKGYKDLDKSPEDIITEISFELPNKNCHFNFEKVSKRIHLDIASVNSAMQIEVIDGIIKKAFISAGGIGPIPTFLKKTCAYLMDKNLNSETIIKAQEILQSEISPISDVRGTDSYKRLLLRQLYFAHFISLFPNKINLNSLA